MCFWHLVEMLCDFRHLIGMPRDFWRLNEMLRILTTYWDAMCFRHLIWMPCDFLASYGDAICFWYPQDHLIIWKNFVKDRRDVGSRSKIILRSIYTKFKSSNETVNICKTTDYSMASKYNDCIVIFLQMRNPKRYKQFRLYFGTRFFSEHYIHPGKHCHVHVLFLLRLCSVCKTKNYEMYRTVHIILVKVRWSFHSSEV